MGCTVWTGWISGGLYEAHGDRGMRGMVRRHRPGVLGHQALTAQPPGISRAILLKVDLGGMDGKEAIMGTAESAPGVAAGKHYHHGDELGYVLEGTAVMAVEGKAPATLKAGDSFHIEAGRPHDAKNIGATPAKVLAVWIVDKGKPFAVPVR
jgi:quercetin dioxygenase-like cupin family protein